MPLILHRRCFKTINQGVGEMFLLPSGQPEHLTFLSSSDAFIFDFWSRNCLHFVCVRFIVIIFVTQSGKWIMNGIKSKWSNGRLALESTYGKLYLQTVKESGCWWKMDETKWSNVSSHLVIQNKVKHRLGDKGSNDVTIHKFFCIFLRNFQKI